MSNSAPTDQKRPGGLPILQGVSPLKGVRIGAELVAGVTLAALAISEVMGYTKIAGTPIVTGVVGVGVEPGIILAIVLSIIVHISHSYRPSDHLVVRDEAGHWTLAPVAGAIEAEPGLAIYRFGANPYYANANRFTEEVLGVAEAADPPLKWLCLAAGGIADVDYSAAATLRQVRAELAERGVTLVPADVQTEMRAELERYGPAEEIGAKRFFDGLDDVVEAFGPS